jgi:hypothetical protein
LLAPAPNFADVEEPSDAVISRNELIFPIAFTSSCPVLAPPEPPGSMTGLPVR